MLLHSAMHGVNTNDKPLNISVGYITPLDSGLTTTLADWTQQSGVSTHRIGSTMELDIDSITANGPQFRNICPAKQLTKTTQQMSHLHLIFGHLRQIQTN